MDSEDFGEGRDAVFELPGHCPTCHWDFIQDTLAATVFTCTPTPKEKNTNKDIKLRDIFGAEC